jgi:hypothetical protein
MMLWLVGPRTEPSTEKQWGGSKLLPGVGRSLSRYRPVLALTVLREVAGSRQILVGVRDPRANRTHPDVASVPTRRVPDLLAREWQSMIRKDRGAEYPGLAGEITALLGLKLGLADPLERGEVTFRIGSVGASQGISVIGEDHAGVPETEELTMFNAEIVLERGADLLPKATASYSALVWAELDAFTRMVRMHEVEQLDAGLNALFCAYGLCLQTSQAMLGTPDRSKSALFTRSSSPASAERVAGRHARLPDRAGST